MSPEHHAMGASMAAVLEAIVDLELPMEELIRDSLSVCIEIHVGIEYCH